MNQPRTYHGFLDTLVGNPAAIDVEKARLDQTIRQISSDIKNQLTPSTVPGLLWHIALKELERVSQLVGIPLSDFAGHARYLRSLCAAVTFTSVEPSENPKTDDLLQLCEHLWHAMFYREMIDDLKYVGTNDPERNKRTVAALASLLNAVQGELAYIEQVEERVTRIFAPFSKEIIEPAIGISTVDALIGFRLVREAIPKRIVASRELMKPAYELWQEYRRRSFAGASSVELDKFVFQHPDHEKIGQKIAASVSGMNNVLLFRPTDFEAALGERSAAFLEAFSFRPGEVNVDLRSPKDDDEVRRRPFARIGDDRFVLLDVCYCSFAPPHRFLECFDTDRKTERLNKRRDETLEDEAARLFGSVIEPDLMLRSYYLPIGKNGGLAERDLLILKGDCVFLILLCDFSFPSGPRWPAAQFRPPGRELSRGRMPVVDACLLRPPERPVDHRGDLFGAGRRRVQQLRENGSHLRHRHRGCFFPRRSFSNCRNHNANRDRVMWWCQPVQLLTS